MHPSRSAILTGRFSIRSGTHSNPIGEGLDGLTQWQVTVTLYFKVGTGNHDIKHPSNPGAGLC